MGVILWDAGKPEHLDAFIRYVDMHRAERIFAILTKGGTEVILRPRVQSRIDSALMRNLTEKTWAMLKESMDHANLEVVEADSYLWAEDRVLATEAE